MDGRSKPISMKSIITIECNESHKQICFMRELHGSGNCDIHLGYYVTRKNVFYVCMYVCFRITIRKSFIASIYSNFIAFIT